MVAQMEIGKRGKDFLFAQLPSCLERRFISATDEMPAVIPTGRATVLHFFSNVRIQLL